MSRWHIRPDAGRWLTEAIAKHLTALGVAWTVGDVRACGRDRTPTREYWFSDEVDVKLVCADCGDRASIGSTTPTPPRCSCEALAVLELERPTASLRALADPRAARAGRCCIAGCTAAGKNWRRTSLTPAGTRAVRTCDRHELLGEYLLSRLTMEDAVRLATPAQVRAAARIAEQESQRARAHACISASLRGASSATYTHALLAGAHEREAECQRAFARAVADGVAQEAHS